MGLQAHGMLNAGRGMSRECTVAPGKGSGQQRGAARQRAHLRSWVQKNRMPAQCGEPETGSTSSCGPMILLRRAAAGPIACWVRSTSLPSPIAATSRALRAATRPAPHPARPKQPLLHRSPALDIMGVTATAMLQSPAAAAAAPRRRQACRPAAAAAARPALASLSLRRAAGVVLTCRCPAQQPQRRVAGCSVRAASGGGSSSGSSGSGSTVSSPCLSTLQGALAAHVTYKSMPAAAHPSS